MGEFTFKTLKASELNKIVNNLLDGQKQVEVDAPRKSSNSSQLNSEIFRILLLSESKARLTETPK
jgi:hypothetical protein